MHSSNQNIDIDSNLHEKPDSDNLLSEREDVLKLCGYDDPNAVPVLIKIVENDVDMLNRAIAAEALGEIGDSSAVPALIKVMENNEDKFVKMSVAEALGKIGKSNVSGLHTHENASTSERV